MRRQTRLTTLLFCLLALAAAQRAFATIEITVGCTEALAGPSAFGVGHVFSGSAAPTARTAHCEIETFLREGLTLESGTAGAIEQSFFFPISVPPPPLDEEHSEALVDPAIQVLLLGPPSRWSE